MLPTHSPFLLKTPSLFYHYHSFLELQKHQLCQLLPYLLSLHLDLPECTIYIHSSRYPESCPCHSISFIVALPHYHTNFNPWKLEFNPQNSTANTSKVYHCTLAHIVEKDVHPFPSSFYLLNTSKDAIYSTPWYLSIPFSISSLLRQKFKLSFFENIHHLLPLHSSIYSSYIPCT